jgi:hypothetical protein
MAKVIYSFLFFVLLFHSVNGVAQNKPFIHLVQELKDLCFQHGTLHTDYETVALKDAGLSYQVLLKEYPEEFEIPDNKDSIDIGSLKYYYQLKIKQKFNEVMHHPALLKHDLSKILSSVLVSDDKKLYCLTIDENTGGSYHSRITFYHYTDMASTHETAFEGFAKDGYHEIHTLQTKQGTKYLLIGTVITCNTCRATYALLTHFEKNKFVHDFETLLDSRLSGDITFSTDTKVLSVGYQTSDFIRNCWCENDQTKDAEEEEIAEENENILYDCSCTYIFDGQTFKLLSQQSEIAEE